MLVDRPGEVFIGFRYDNADGDTVFCITNSSFGSNEAAALRAAAQRDAAPGIRYELWWGFPPASVAREIHDLREERQQ